MAIFEMPRHVDRGAPISGSLFGLYSTLLAWNDARATRKSLSALTDRELDDIGLVRGDIDRIANS